MAPWDSKMRWQPGGNYKPLRLICELNWRECPYAMAKYFWSEMFTDVIDFFSNEHEGLMFKILLASFILTIFYTTIRWIIQRHNDKKATENFINTVEYRIQNIEYQLDTLENLVQFVGLQMLTIFRELKKSNNTGISEDFRVAVSNTIFAIKNYQKDFINYNKNDHSNHLNNSEEDNESQKKLRVIRNFMKFFDENLSKFSHLFDNKNNDDIDSIENINNLFSNFYLNILESENCDEDEISKNMQLTEINYINPSTPLDYIDSEINSIDSSSDVSPQKILSPKIFELNSTFDFDELNFAKTDLSDKKNFFENNNEDLKVQEAGIIFTLDQKKNIGVEETNKIKKIKENSLNSTKIKENSLNATKIEKNSLIGQNDSEIKLDKENPENDFFQNNKKIFHEENNANKISTGNNSTLKLKSNEKSLEKNFSIDEKHNKSAGIDSPDSKKNSRNNLNSSEGIEENPLIGQNDSEIKLDKENPGNYFFQNNKKISYVENDVNRISTEEKLILKQESLEKKISIQEKHNKRVEIDSPDSKKNSRNNLNPSEEIDEILEILESISRPFSASTNSSSQVEPDEDEREEEQNSEINVSRNSRSFKTPEKNQMEAQNIIEKNSLDQNKFEKFEKQRRKMKRKKKERNHEKDCRRMKKKKTSLEDVKKQLEYLNYTLKTFRSQQQLNEVDELDDFNRLKNLNEREKKFETIVRDLTDFSSEKPLFNEFYPTNEQIYSVYTFQTYPKWRKVQENEDSVVITELEKPENENQTKETKNIEDKGDNLINYKMATEKFNSCNFGDLLTSGDVNLEKSESENSMKVKKSPGLTTIQDKLIKTNDFNEFKQLNDLEIFYNKSKDFYQSNLSDILSESDNIEENDSISTKNNFLFINPQFDQKNREIDGFFDDSSNFHEEIIHSKDLECSKDLETIISFAIDDEKNFFQPEEEIKSIDVCDLNLNLNSTFLLDEKKSPDFLRRCFDEQDIGQVDVDKSDVSWKNDFSCEKNFCDLINLDNEELELFENQKEKCQTEFFQGNEFNWSGQIDKNEKNVEGDFCDYKAINNNENSNGEMISNQFNEDIKFIPIKSLELFGNKSSHNSKNELSAEKKLSSQNSLDNCAEKNSGSSKKNYKQCFDEFSFGNCEEKNSNDQEKNYKHHFNAFSFKNCPEKNYEQHFNGFSFTICPEKNFNRQEKNHKQPFDALSFDISAEENSDNPKKNYKQPFDAFLFKNCSEKNSDSSEKNYKQHFDAFSYTNCPEKNSDNPEKNYKRPFEASSLKNCPEKNSDSSQKNYKQHLNAFSYTNCPEKNSDNPEKNYKQHFDAFSFKNCHEKNSNNPEKNDKQPFDALSFDNCPEKNSENSEKNYKPPYDVFSSENCPEKNINNQGKNITRPPAALNYSLINDKTFIKDNEVKKEEIIKRKTKIPSKINDNKIVKADDDTKNYNSNIKNDNNNQNIKNDNNNNNYHYYHNKHENFDKVNSVYKSSDLNSLETNDQINSPSTKETEDKNKNIFNNFKNSVQTDLLLTIKTDDSLINNSAFVKSNNLYPLINGKTFIKDEKNINNKSNEKKMKIKELKELKENKNSDEFFGEKKLIMGETLNDESVEEDYGNNKAKEISKNKIKNDGETEKSDELTQLLITSSIDEEKKKYWDNLQNEEVNKKEEEEEKKQIEETINDESYYYDANSVEKSFNTEIISGFQQSINVSKKIYLTEDEEFNLISRVNNRECNENLINYGIFESSKNCGEEMSLECFLSNNNWENLSKIEFENEFLDDLNRDCEENSLINVSTDNSSVYLTVDESLSDISFNNSNKCDKNTNSNCFTSVELKENSQIIGIDEKNTKKNETDAKSLGKIKIQEKNDEKIKIGGKKIEKINTHKSKLHGNQKKILSDENEFMNGENASKIDEHEGKNREKIEIEGKNVEKIKIEEKNIGKMETGEQNEKNSSEFDEHEENDTKLTSKNIKKGNKKNYAEEINKLKFSKDKIDEFKFSEENKINEFRYSEENKMNKFNFSDDNINIDKEGSDNEQNYNFPATNAKKNNEINSELEKITVVNKNSVFHENSSQNSTQTFDDNNYLNDDNNNNYYNTKNNNNNNNFEDKNNNKLDENNIYSTRKIINETDDRKKIKNIDEKKIKSPKKSEKTLTKDEKNLLSKKNRHEDEKNNNKKIINTSESKKELKIPEVLKGSSLVESLMSLNVKESTTLSEKFRSNLNLVKNSHENSTLEEALNINGLKQRSKSYITPRNVKSLNSRCSLSSRESKKSRKIIENDEKQQKIIYKNKNLINEDLSRNKNMKLQLSRESTPTSRAWKSNIPVSLSRKSQSDSINDRNFPRYNSQEHQKSKKKSDNVKSPEIKKNLDEFHFPDCPQHLKIIYINIGANQEKDLVTNRSSKENTIDTNKLLKCIRQEEDEKDIDLSVFEDNRVVFRQQKEIQVLQECSSVDTSTSISDLSQIYHEKSIVDVKNDNYKDIDESKLNKNS